MTMIIVSIISIPLSLLVGAHVKSVFKSEEDAVAWNLARWDMDRVNKMIASASPTSAYDASVVSAGFSNYQGYNYDVTRTVTYAQGSGATTERLKKIQVDVKKSGQTEVIASLVTYLARNVAYGL